MPDPAPMLYDVDDTPALGVLLLSALQHVAVIAMILVYPIRVAHEAGATPAETQRMLVTSMLVMGLGAILQGGLSHRLGSRALCPPCFTAAYLPGSLVAAHLGGLPLVFGMTAVGGVIECALSRMIPWLQRAVPPYAAGVIIVMIGASVGSLGAADVLGAEGPRGLTLLVSTVTLTVMLVAGGSRRPVHRAFAALIGLLAGWLLAAVSGVAPAWPAPACAGGSLPGLRDFSPARLAFRADLLLLFGIAAVTTAVRVAADIATCARQSRAPAVETDTTAATARGVLANGLTTLLSGLLGSLGVGTSTANVALARATGVRSRRVGYVIGVMFAALAFLPGPASFLVAMPPTLTGPALIYVACFIVMNGVSLIAAPAPLARTPVGVGLPFLAGLVALSHPAHTATLPPVAQAAASDPLTASTLTALAISGMAAIARRARALAQSVRSTVVSGVVTARRLR